MLEKELRDNKMFLITILISDNLLFWTVYSSDSKVVMNANRSEEHIIASIHRPHGITQMQDHLYITQPDT